MSQPTYYLVCLHRPCSQEAAQYIADALSKGRHEGGADLIVRQEKMDAEKSGLVLHISASEERLFQIAEDLDLKKADKNNVMREFRIDIADQFPPIGLIGPLSLADIHKCVQFAMESVHFDRTTKTLPGHGKNQVMKCSPVLSAYREAGLVDTFPLHDDETLKKCYAAWVKGPLLDPPVDQIRDYFGENVALYVSFVAFYTKFLIPIAALGIIQFALEHFLSVNFLYNNIAFACLNLIAVTIFLEMWKRRSSSHSYDWGTGGKLRHKRARPEFRGEYGLNPITGRDEVQYPIRKTVQKMMLVSMPLTFGCLCFAFILMLLSFEADRAMADFFREPETGELPGDILIQGLLFVPSVIYSILIYLMNLKYLYLAHKLTEWENHRTQEQFERYVVVKLVLFEFVNTFLSLFYIAFYLQDIVMLKSQVFTMLIVIQVVNQVQETILPIFLHRPSARRVMHKIHKKLEDKIPGEHCQHDLLETVECLDREDNQVSIANFSLKRDPFESTYDDFMEMWLQFGHVFLFSSVYPLAGFFALVNNLIELRTDAYKLCRLTRKPTPRGVRDIGAWYPAFALTSIVSVLTNCALLAMDKELQSFASPDISSKTWILIFVGIEHTFLCLRFALAFLIPDVSKRVKDAIDRDDFLLKNEASDHGKRKRD